ncbi:glutamate-5-semialdehyde dehydrogenase [Paenibacillus thermotolerans]|uniref:glutamate-5-semialdehyde dehydrogenase n=1 Tax=Paenibacillus thermotolerans TaxID=3027807 RepID=UPI002368ACE8|nr:MULTISPECIES: glutamate-5-semialdehyde dehydrogenase [unclassified Paenibacillus]
MSEARQKALIAKRTTSILGGINSDAKNEALQRIASELIARYEMIAAANQQDLNNGKANGLSAALLDRLTLTRKRVEAMADGLHEVTALPDPVGDTLHEIVRPNGLRIKQVRVPIGLIGIIYEARPNVTVDAAGLCLKTGNAVLLRGGSAALHTNTAIVEAIHAALAHTAIPPEAVQLITDPNRSSVDDMLTLSGILDCIIPRGGASLIRNVVDNAKVPVIETGAGICHTFIDESADPQMALSIALNAKVQRPSVCNAMETLLVHREFAEKHFRSIVDAFKERDVELRGCEESRKLATGISPATSEDYSTEYNDYILNMKIVGSLDEALEHIAAFGTMHSECIVTENTANAARFLAEVDAAAVYHNASTRFTDGFEFGFGAEIGISTQKLHARGPMGLPALTSTKYIVTGSGQIRE